MQIEKTAITKELMRIDTRRQMIDIQQIDNRRFMYNPKTGILVLGYQYAATSTMVSSHANELADAGITKGYDDFVRGWIGTGGDYPKGVIHFAPCVDKRNITLFDRNKENERFSDETADSIVTACYEMGKVCTGALIVVEQAIRLTEYESTGIQLDCLVSSQVLINIFEHNTPLHDGAIIVRGDRIVSATCYLPLSDNMSISKDLGTRHRAALGMSEVSDALVIVVSEETGAVSAALGGKLYRDIKEDELRKMLTEIQAPKKEEGKLHKFWKGRRKNEKRTDE